jgi:hypothetical protein
MNMFERGHVKPRLVDKVPKHSKHLKNALHHASPFQMLQIKQRNEEIQLRSECRKWEMLREFCRSLRCVNCEADSFWK